ncbi:ubiquitin-like protein 7 isoform 9-T13 [Molossus nigricans]
MTKPLTSMAFNLDPRSMFCASPGRSLIRNQNLWTKWLLCGSSGCCTLPCIAAPPTGRRSLRCSAIRNLWIRSLWPPQASAVTPLLLGFSRTRTFSLFLLIPTCLIRGFLFEGLSDDEDDFHPRARSTPSSSTPSSRPASLGYSGAAGPRPITQSELATALALASTPESSSHTPTPGTQGHSSGTSPLSSGVQSGTPITNDLFSQALQHALQASGQPNLQSQWQPQLQQLRDMGIQDDELSLRALQATAGDIQAALELIFAGGAP